MGFNTETLVLCLCVRPSEYVIWSGKECSKLTIDKCKAEMEVGKFYRAMLVCSS